MNGPTAKTAKNGREGAKKRAVVELRSTGQTRASAPTRACVQSPAASTAGNSAATVFSSSFALVTSMTEATTMALPMRM
jgi:hypothetical protein